LFSTLLIDEGVQFSLSPRVQFYLSPDNDEPDDDAQRQRVMQRSFGAIARQVSLDPGDDTRM